MARNPLAAAIPNAPLVDAAGNVVPVWRDWFHVLLSRTGGAVGVSAGDADARITAEAAGRIAADNALGTALATERTARDAADAAELAARVAADTDLATRVADSPPAVLLETGTFGAKISDLAAFSLTMPPVGTEKLPVVEAGATTAMTLAQQYTLFMAWLEFVATNPLDAPAASNASGAAISVLAGTGDGTGDGGAVIIQAGSGGATSGAGGPVSVSAGDATGAGNGGAFIFTAGNGVGVGNGGGFGMTAGNAATTGAGGAFAVGAGAGGVTSGDGGALQFTSGSAITSGNGGALTLTTGAGAGAADNGGDITITLGSGAGTGHTGRLILVNMPTADPGVSGAVWVDTGSSPHTLRVSP